MSIEVYPLFPGGGEVPTSPTQFTLHEIGVDLAMELNDTWHSVLPDTNRGNLLRNRHAVFYGLEYDSRWYAVGIWTDPIAGNLMKENNMIELRRLAISEDAPKNTATRMLKLMRESIKRKYTHLKKAVSYQAVDYHHGTIYKADNWTKAAETKGREWNTPSRQRTPTQAAASDKIRWERRL